MPTHEWNSSLYETVKELRICSMMDVDARVRGGLMTVCEFGGHETNPEKTRKCKHYFKSANRDCCGHYREDIKPEKVGICTKEGWR